MEHDVKIKQLEEELNISHSKLRSYAKLGELYEKAKSEIDQLRAEKGKYQREHTNGPGVLVSVARPSTMQINEFECNDENMLNNEINYSSSAPVSFNAMREQTMIQEPEVDNNNKSESFQRVSSEPSIIHIDVKLNEIPLSSKLTTLTNDIFKLEQKLAHLIAENEKLKLAIDLKDKKIIALKDEIRFLKESKLSAQVLKSAKDEWVKLSDDKSTDVSISVPEYNFVIETEEALKKDIANLTKTVHELKAANRSWECHLKKVTEDNANSMQANLNEIENLKQQAAEAIKQMEKKQEEFDKLLSSTNKQNEDLLTSKLKAVEEFENCKKQLEQAKAALVQSQAALAQAQLDKKAAVEGRSKELGKIIEGQREYIIKLESQAMRESHMKSLQLSGSARPPQGSSEAAGSELSMSTEVVLLHQQIALWKEDFEKEREDREKVQMELDRMRKISLEERQQLHRERDSVRMKKDKIEQLERENKDLLAKYTEATMELQRIKTKAGQREKTQVSPSTRAPRKWNCRRCTYMNTAEERTCVMCGQESWLKPPSPTTAAGREHRHHRCHQGSPGLDQCDCLRSNDELEFD